MIKPVLRIAVVIVVATVATIIVAQEVDEPSVVKPMVLAERGNLEKAVEQADANYHKRLEPSEKRIRALRCRSVIATCKRTIAALERAAKAATSGGANLEAVMARDKIDTVKERLAKAQADMPEGMDKSKPISIKLTKIAGVRMKHGRHYYLAVLKRATWNEASRMAKAYGGYLVTIESPQEMIFLQKVACINLWVGGEPGGDPVQWQWENGTKISDRLWENKKPDMRSDHRVVMSQKGLKINGDKRQEDGFIIEWNR
jgi:hypothetical protein